MKRIAFSPLGLEGGKELFVRPAAIGDLDRVTIIFGESFPETRRKYFGHTPSWTVAVHDLFSFILEAEPDLFQVACGPAGEVTGYIVVSCGMRRLWRHWLRNGYARRWGGRFLRGEYGLAWPVLPLLALNKVNLWWVTRRMDETGYRGQIVSLAVAESQRGRGIGHLLLGTGLGLLHEREVTGVKLEVRPGNAAARALYERHDFRYQDRFNDCQGPWLVMVKRF